MSSSMSPLSTHLFLRPHPRLRPRCLAPPVPRRGLAQHLAPPLFPWVSPRGAVGSFAGIAPLTIQAPVRLRVAEAGFLQCCEPQN